MKKRILYLVFGLLFLSLSFVSLSNAKGTQEEVKGVGWYVANIPEARKQNQVCHDNPALKDTPSCVNSLHALEISFKGNN